MSPRLAVILALLVAAALFLAARALISDTLAPAPSEPAEPAEPAATLLPLPPPSPLDETLIIEIGAPKSGFGTAFAIDTGGRWVTARHVVDGCTHIALDIAPGMRVPAQILILSDEADLALLASEPAQSALTLDAAPALQQGEPGFFTGFPLGRAGDVSARLANHARLITQGRRETNAPVLSWIEFSRSGKADGSLSGISGAPVFDVSGKVRGVVVAESTSRRRLYSTSPGALAAFLAAADLPVTGGAIESFTEATYRDRAAALRQTRSIVPVYCEVLP